MTLGTWERERIQDAFLVASLPVIGISAALGLAAYGVWRIAKQYGEVVEDIGGIVSQGASTWKTAFGYTPVGFATKKAGLWS